MDDHRLSELCDELRSFANASPGVNPARTLRARSIAQEIQRSVDVKGTGIREDAIDVIDGFQLWFSPRKWNQSGDEGQRVKAGIFASISKLEGAVGFIHSSRTKPKRPSSATASQARRVVDPPI